MPETIGLRGSRPPLRRPPDYPSERPACSEQALAGGGGVRPLGIENEVSESTRLSFSVESWVGVNVSAEKQTEAAGGPRDAAVVCAASALTVVSLLCTLCEHTASVSASMSESQEFSPVF